LINILLFVFLIRSKRGKRTRERKILKKFLTKKRRKKLKRKAKLANPSRGQPRRKINVE